MGKSISKLSLSKKKKTPTSSDLNPEPEDVTPKHKNPNRRQTTFERNETACYHVLHERVKINLKITNAGSIINSMDLTKKDIIFVDELHSFETETERGIEVSSKWTLRLRVNPSKVDQTSMYLCLYMGRNALDSSISTTTPIPVHATFDGDIRIVSEDLFKSKKKEDKLMQKKFGKIPTTIGTEKCGHIYKEYSEPFPLGVCIWNTETLDALREVGRNRRVDLIIQGYISLSRTGRSPLSLIKNTCQKVESKRFVLDSKKDWRKRWMSLLLKGFKCYYDVKIVFPQGRGELDAHRFILAGFSPVFSKMLDTEMVEKKNGKIKMNDVSREGMKYALNIMYTGSLVESYTFEGNVSQEVGSPRLINNAMAIWYKYADEIAYIAEKYQIECLKEFCDKNLSRKCTRKNASLLFKTAQLYALEGAKKKISKFIKSNS